VTSRGATRIGLSKSDHWHGKGASSGVGDGRFPVPWCPGALVPWCPGALVQVLRHTDATRLPDDGVTAR